MEGKQEGSYRGSGGDSGYIRQNKTQVNAVKKDNLLIFGQNSVTWNIQKKIIGSCLANHNNQALNFIYHVYTDKMCSKQYTFEKGYGA